MVCGPRQLSSVELNAELSTLLGAVQFSFFRSPTRLECTPSPALRSSLEFNLAAVSQISAE